MTPFTLTLSAFVFSTLTGLLGVWMLARYRRRATSLDLDMEFSTWFYIRRSSLLYLGIGAMIALSVLSLITMIALFVAFGAAFEAVQAAGVR